MEFDHLGARCHTCNRQDYLPWDCDICQKKFCKLHIKNHTCVKKKIIKPSKKKIRRKMIKCKLCKKKIAPLLSINCSYCYNQYCIPHRQPEIHNCSGLTKNKFIPINPKHVKKKNCFNCLVNIFSKSK